MQTLKDQTKEKILIGARDEFVAKGFSKSSMRAIAQKAGISVGNIYKYFESKDALFRAMLYLAIREIEELIQSHNNENNLTLSVFTSEESTIYMQNMLSIVRRKRPELRLLLFGAEGTSLANYRDSIVESQVSVGKEYIRLMKEKYPHLDDNISPFFLRLNSLTWCSIFFELVKHDNYTEEEIRKTIEQYVHFSTAGWKELLRPF